MKEEGNTAPGEGKSDTEERFSRLWDLVFGKVPEPSEKAKERAVPRDPENDPLEYIPASWDEHIPKEVVEARLALLSEDDGKALKKEIDSGRDPLGVYLYFGGWPFATDQENVSAAMTRICAYVGGDVETTLRLFKGCALSCLDFTEEELYFMAKEAVDFVNEFRDTMAKMNRPTFGYDKKIGLSRYGSRKRR
ncbi:MAG: hypothetical protein LUD47_02535 [Clostridia bacterium]|nr:hypothetical protein [Clostridia bacterium]